MIRKVPARQAITAAILLLSAPAGQAQPLLPDMLGATQNGMNVLTWTCQYDGIKSIAVQRSRDSVVNYATIGYVKDLSKGPQAFIDGHPLAGSNWYRLYIVFGSNLTWYGNALKLEVDSQQLLQQLVLPPNDSLQAFASRVKTVEVPAGAANGKTVVANTSEQQPARKVVIDSVRGKRPPPAPKQPVIRIPDIAAEAADLSAYIKSQYVFTNPFTGHVNVEIPDARKYHFSIRFFNRDEDPVLEIPRIGDPSVIIDRRNFQHKGLYKFELRKDKALVETGFITIY